MILKLTAKYLNQRIHFSVNATENLTQGKHTLTENGNTHTRTHKHTHNRKNTHTHILALQKKIISKLVRHNYKIIHRTLD